MNLKGKPPLEIKDVRVTGVDISGDGDAWIDFKQTDFVQTGGGLPHIIDLLTNGERVLVRTRYVDIYNNGTNGLPKVGPIYEFKRAEQLALDYDTTQKRFLEPEKTLVLVGGGVL